jgi:hypothetical protein
MWAALGRTLASIDLGFDQIAMLPLGTSLGLCLGYRIINAYGWALSLSALGHRVGAATGMRIWLISESCRWIPGSVWGFGSRAVLAARQGVDPAVAGASVLIELLLTVAGWAFVALSGWFFLPGLLEVVAKSPRLTLVIGVVALIVMACLPLCWLFAARSSRIDVALDKMRVRAQLLRRVKPDGRALTVALAFYTVMAIVNGLVFVAVLVAMPGARACPITAAVAANAIAWLVGFFAIFAPGGLIVREACLAALLTPWIPLPRAAMIALVWRAVQIVSEICCAAGLWIHAALTTRHLASGEPTLVSADRESRDGFERVNDRQSIILPEIGVAAVGSPPLGGTDLANRIHTLS